MTIWIIQSDVFLIGETPTALKRQRVASDAEARTAVGQRCVRRHLDGGRILVPEGRGERGAVVHGQQTAVELDAAGAGVQSVREPEGASGIQADATVEVQFRRSLHDPAVGVVEDELFGKRQGRSRFAQRERTLVEGNRLQRERIIARNNKVCL